MNDNNNELNLLNSKNNLITNSVDTLKRINSTPKKTTNFYFSKDRMTLNYSNKNSNPIFLHKLNFDHTNSNILLKSKNKPSKFKIINDSSKGSPDYNNESKNESEASESKLIKAFTKSSNKNVTNYILNDLNFRNSSKKSKTFQLIHKNYSKTQNKLPYTIFKTQLNEKINDKKLNIHHNNITTLNPLSIPDEDKIFDEAKKYNIYTERYNKRYKIKKITSENKTNKLKNSENITLSKNNITTKNKPIDKNIAENYFGHDHFKVNSDDKELFDCLYKTTDDYFTQLNLLKKTKKRKKLRDYQLDLLESAKPVISLYSYNKLKQDMDEIQKRNKIKKKLNFKYIKKIENKEAAIIKHINKCNKNLKNTKSVGQSKFVFNLPFLKFKRVVQKDNLKKLEKSLTKGKDNNSEVSSSSINEKEEENKKNKKRKIKLEIFEKKPNI